MRRTLLVGALGALLLVLGVPGPASAETLDDHLGFRCGVDHQDPVVNAAFYAAFGPELLQRASLWPAADLGDSKFTSLVWYVGAWNDPRARTLAAEIIAGARGHWPQTTCAGIADHPDWAGLELLIEAAAFGDQPLRDAVLTMLAGIDYTAPVFAAAEGTALRGPLLAELGALRQLETDPRLLGYIATVQEGLAAIALPAGGE